MHSSVHSSGTVQRSLRRRVSSRVGTEGYRLKAILLRKVLPYNKLQVKVESFTSFVGRGSVPLKAVDAGWVFQSIHDQDSYEQKFEKQVCVLDYAATKANRANRDNNILKADRDKEEERELLEGNIAISICFGSDFGAGYYFHTNFAGTPGPDNVLAVEVGLQDLDIENRFRKEFPEGFRMTLLLEHIPNSQSTQHPEKTKKIIENSSPDIESASSEEDDASSREDAYPQQFWGENDPQQPLGENHPPETEGGSLYGAASSPDPGYGVSSPDPAKCSPDQVTKVTKEPHLETGTSTLTKEPHLETGTSTLFVGKAASKISLVSTPQVELGLLDARMRFSPDTRDSLLGSSRSCSSSHGNGVVSSVMEGVAGMANWIVGSKEDTANPTPQITHGA